MRTKRKREKLAYGYHASASDDATATPHTYRCTSKKRKEQQQLFMRTNIPPPPPLHFGGVTVNVATDASGRGFDASERGGGGGGGGNYGRSPHNRAKMETHALLKYNRSFLSDDTMGPQTSFFKKILFFFGNSLSARPHTRLPLLLFPLLSPSVGRKWVRKVAKGGRRLFCTNTRANSQMKNLKT